MPLTFNVLFDFDEIKITQSVQTFIDVDFDPPRYPRSVLEQAIEERLQVILNAPPKLETLEILVPPDLIPTSPLSALDEQRRRVKDMHPLGYDDDLVDIIVKTQNKKPKESLVSLVVRKTDEERDELKGLPVTKEPKPLQRYADVLEAIKTFMPSKAARSREHNIIQADPKRAIFNGFSAFNSNVPVVAPPIQIFHPIFQEFKRVIDDPEFQVSPEILIQTGDFIQAASVIYSTEDLAEERLWPIFSLLLGDHMYAIRTMRRSPDGTVCFQLRPDVVVPLSPWELKHSIGEGGCNPIVQAIFSAANLWAVNGISPVREQCCCPSFAIAGSGPYVSIHGTVFTDKFIAQPLTDLMWVGEASTYEDQNLYRVAKTFAALRHCLAKLKEFYSTLDLDNSCRTPLTNTHPWFYPYPNHFLNPDKAADAEEFITFNYLCALQDRPACVAFLAEDTKSKCKYVVKFVDRYGADAHSHLACKGFAPKLLYCGTLSGDCEDRVRNVFADSKGMHMGVLRMVVMEYVGKGNGISEDPWNSCALVSKALQALHDGGFVHGDLWPPNVIYRDGKALLIDFDWSGKEGEVYYPYGVLEQTKTVAGVGDFDIILKCHDLALLKAHFV